MTKISLSPDKISDILCKYISDKNTIFIFPTDTVMNSWIDWLVLNPEKSGVEAVAFEHFLAWDNFKGQYVQTTKEGYNVIPSILRKFFVSDLIARNAEKSEQERFQVIINPKEEYTQTADSFADWIEKNLSSLYFWKKRLDKNSTSYGELDAEDKDYLLLYEEYQNFLEKNKLLEPAWIETPDFKSNKKFIIFYPELLEDFCDFEEIFSKSENITLCTLPKNLPAPIVYRYKDSRSELRQTILRIIELAESGRADWSEIALSVPNIETYRPYLEREFSLYNIPYVIKSGQSLTKNCAGRIFREIYDCHSENFTFDSVRTLVLDECVPWKDEYKELRENLIREGNRMRCLCSPEEKDIWRQSFSSKIKRLELSNADENEIKTFKELEKFYNELHSSVEKFFNDDNKTFASIKENWIKFRTQFLKETHEFSDEANNILGRCIKELESIMVIEKNYKDCNLKITSPYEFFLHILDSKTYTPQTKISGVQIFKYKLSAAANFKYQFIIDSSQKNLEVQYRRLTFLNATKRTKLHLVEDDRIRNASDIFLKLYAKNSFDKCGADSDFVHFSYAEESFNGYAIPHSKLKENKNPPLKDELDYIKTERDFISRRTPDGAVVKIQRLTKNQKEQYRNWKQTNVSSSKDINYRLGNKLDEKIKARYDKENKKLRVSARGDLEKFFPCPRRWVLQSLLHIHDDSLDTELMQNYDMGNLHHKILEFVIQNFEGKPLPFVQDDEFYSAEKPDENITPDILNLINEKVEKAIKAPSDFRDSFLAVNTLETQKEKIALTITSFLKFLLPYYDSDKPKGFGGCTVISTEKSYMTEKDNFNYYGKIDCLLQTPDGKKVIIDYKNTYSSIPSEKDMTPDKNDILGDFQLPVYYKLLNIQTEDIAGGFFYAIKDNKNRGFKKDLDQALRAVDEYSETFINEVSKAALIPHYSDNQKDRQNVKSYEACIKCPCKIICRTTYTVAGKDIIKNEVQK